MTDETRIVLNEIIIEVIRKKDEIVTSDGLYELGYRDSCNDITKIINKHIEDIERK